MKVIGCKIVPIILHFLFGIVILLLVSTQNLYEAVNQPDKIVGEAYYTVKQGNYGVTIRVVCLSPAINTNSGRMILLEHGGGSSSIDMLDLQLDLSKDWTTCSYDRAGYGKSTMAPYP